MTPPQSPTIGPNTTEVPRLAYSVEETAATLGVGRDAIFDLIRTNRLRTFKIGARRLVALRDIEDFIEHAPAEVEAS